MRALDSSCRFLSPPSASQCPEQSSSPPPGPATMMSCLTSGPEQEGRPPWAESQKPPAKMSLSSSKQLLAGVLVTPTKWLTQRPGVQPRLWLSDVGPHSRSSRQSPSTPPLTRGRGPPFRVATDLGSGK